MRRVGRCLQGSPFQSSVASSGLNNSADGNDDDVRGSWDFSRPQTAEHRRVISDGDDEGGCVSQGPRITKAIDTYKYLTLTKTKQGVHW